jgi:hypothetical protein
MCVADNLSQRVSWDDWDMYFIQPTFSWIFKIVRKGVEFSKFLASTISLERQEDNAIIKFILFLFYQHVQYKEAKVFGCLRMFLAEQ